MSSIHRREPVHIDVGSVFDHPGERNVRRERTVSKLLDALNELGMHDSDEVDPINVMQHASFEDDGDVPGVNEQLQQAGADAFNRFQRKINNFDKELRTCVNAARQLGSSVAILASVFQLRDRLTQISFLFRENAADLYPRKVLRLQRESLVGRSKFPRRRLARLRASLERGRRPPGRMELDKLDLEDFPQQLELFASDLSTFLCSLDEFPEFTDKAVDAPIIAFEDDLKYWASCLMAYEGKLKSPTVRRYLHELMEDVGEHLNSVSTALSMFIEVGIPTIRFAQQHGALNFLNLSKIATFFSAVTATTLQYSYQNVGTGAADAVNGFWFTSMVFSIAAAVNSLLGLTWKQSVYRSPGHHVPWWVLIWLKRSPLVFLVLSVSCFSIGLVFFSYSSKQNSVVSTITTVFTAFSSFGLIAVSTWFIFERWVFIRYRGSKWLRDSLDDYRIVIAEVTSRRRLLSAMHRASDAWARAKAFLIQFIRLRPTAEITAPSDSWSSLTHAPSSTIGTLPFNASGSLRTRSPSPMAPANPDAPAPLPGHHLPEAVTGGAVQRTGRPARRARFVQAIRSVIIAQQGASPSIFSPGVMRQEELRGLIRSSRVARLSPKLRDFAPTQEFAAHQALVRHLQFSPDGNFLATSSWDNTSAIFRTGDPFSSHRTLAHSSYVSQVAWSLISCTASSLIPLIDYDRSPSGIFLLTKLARSIKVWTDMGVCRQSIERSNPVHSVRWLPGSEAFMSVEGTQIVKMDLTGRVLDVYQFERLAIHDVCITPDGQRLLGFGTLLSSGAGLKPCKCRAEKQIIVYNLDRRVIETHVPLLHTIRDITLSRSGQFALISHELKVPPQLWKLVAFYDWEKVDPIQTMTLSLRHTYIPKTAVDFAGSSSFGGRDDELVLCAGKDHAEGKMRAGDIHIWDRESASYLHHIPPPALGGDMTCIAWNPAADPFMFATGSHDGTVQIWTTSEMVPANSHPLHTPRTEAPAPQSDGPGDKHIVGLVLQGSGHRYIPVLEQDSVDITEKYVPPGEVSPEPLNALTLRRHSWF
ncbi:WD40-repeat-containing domain protein [Russula earlei]|uniref:WD40-repeat-containing domain protein n=1 Tax=Russula earlei TaxID=71964 RepID=A0ACC0UCK3_9AGAM|nr:WD40-repeat-containing domain protein [Russula earlei]